MINIEVIENFPGMIIITCALISTSILYLIYRWKDKKYIKKNLKRGIK